MVRNSSATFRGVDGYLVSIGVSQAEVDAFRGWFIE
jgi:hypothetical protein